MWITPESPGTVQRGSVAAGSASRASPEAAEGGGDSTCCFLHPEGNAAPLPVPMLGSHSVSLLHLCGAPNPFRGLSCHGNVLRVSAGVPTLGLPAGAGRIWLLCVPPLGLSPSLPHCLCFPLGPWAVYCSQPECFSKQHLQLFTSDPTGGYFCSPCCCALGVISAQVTQG